MSDATPGPWIAVANRGNNAVSDVVDRDGYTIAHCRNVSVGCWDANARLIAAAPDTAAERDRLKAVNADLLAALRLTAEQALRSEIPEGYGPEFRSKEWEAGYDAAISAARAAIARAEGGAE